MFDYTPLAAYSNIFGKIEIGEDKVFILAEELDSCGSAEWTRTTSISRHDFEEIINQIDRKIGGGVNIYDHCSASRYLLNEVGIFDHEGDPERRWWY